MTYKEFQETYYYARKMWPDVHMIFSDNMDEKICTEKKTEYVRVGSRWKKAKETTEPFSRLYYMNCVDAVPFFRRLGGSERVTKGYTIYGLIPVSISSVSPDGTEKVVREFVFS